MSRTKALVVEDELIIAEKIKGILEDLDIQVVGIAMSYEEGVELFNSHDVDILLADINLDGKKDGIDLIGTLKKKSQFTSVIISSYTDEKTLAKAKTVKPDAYLVKPFSKEDLRCCVEIASLKVQSEEPLTEDYSVQAEHIYIKSRNSIVRLRHQEIIYVQSDDIYCKLHMSDGKSHLIRYSLKKLTDRLPANFIRIHKSYAINFDLFEKMDYDHVHIEEHKIPIGRSFREALLERINLI